MAKQMILFEALYWDGGSSHTPSGFVTEDSELAERIAGKHGRVSRKSYVLVESEDDISASKELKGIVDVVKMLSRDQLEALGLSRSPVHATQQLLDLKNNTKK